MEQPAEDVERGVGEWTEGVGRRVIREACDYKMEWNETYGAVGGMNAYKLKGICGRRTGKSKERNLNEGKRIHTKRREIAKSKE